uniref:Large ribosomal subunit protein uL3c n=2 Tax=Pavlovaceae TaxID=418969 RepID=M1K3P4_DIALT|nr:ribosomal protein L3 [Diacronema lutheri]YP_009863748.1 ribosomal protein L3 [Pavlova sp. NIVA-4/92]AGE93726.1 ribosomal protein L3 [Diacronema lutheri]QKE31079.1 ribosomal protein L3 [Pavlova sp. NIVA-4/92]|mmetsp:Transcript_11229/g.35447  ORF Transcript_11229/g.35447 Transcript_11229/m.35447 type:complete len:198 (+) Transcript_11229:272-865(+)
MMLGSKVGMTQIFDDSGFRVPVTVLSAGPCYVTQLLKNYNSVQIGYSIIPEKSLSHSKKKYFERLNISPLKYLKEFSVSSVTDYAVGQLITLEQYQIGQMVQVTSKSIGKGFAGTIKKYHFGRGPMAHGSKNHRAPGSIGASATPARVFPGKQMPGRLGNKTVTIKNLTIVDIDKENNLLVVKGSVPGKRGNLVKIA